MPVGNYIPGRRDLLDERRMASTLSRSSSRHGPRRFLASLRTGVAWFGLLVTAVPAFGQAPGIDAGEARALLNALLVKDEEVRGGALKKIVDFGPDFPGAIEGVLKARENAESPFKERCLAALACLSMDDPKYALEVGELLAAFPTWATDFRAAGVFPVGPQTRVMHGNLLSVMEKKFSSVSGEILLQAGTSRSRSGPTRRILFLGLQQDSAEVRGRASQAFRVDFDNDAFFAETPEEIEAVATALRWGHREKFPDTPAERLPDVHDALGPVSFIRVDPQPDLIRRLGEILKDPNPRVAAWAARCLGLIGPQAKEFEPALKRLAGNPNQEIRLWSSFALASFRGAPAEYLGGITDSLKNPFHPKMRVEACQALSWLGKGARAAAPEVRACVMKPGGGGLISAVATLRRIGGVDKEAEDLLFRGLLEKRNHFFQAECGQALVEMSPAKAAVRAFVEKEAGNLEGSAGSVWIGILLAVERGEESSLCPDLAGALFDWSTPLTHQAACALKVLGPKAAAAVPILKQILALKDWRRVDQVMGVLSSIGKEAIPLLVESSRSPRWWVRASAVRNLKRMKAPPPEVQKALEDALRDADEDVRRAARE